MSAVRTVGGKSGVKEEEKVEKVGKLKIGEWIGVISGVGVENSTGIFI